MKKKVVITLIVIVLVLTLGISLAYFTPIITGSGKEISLVAKELKVIYTDTSQINASIIEPGWHVNKTFSVQNKSDGEYKYDIVIKDLINTFVTENYLQYKITSDNNGYNCDWTNVPKSEQQLDTILAHSVSINDKEIQNYTIEFRYLETEEDQSEDMGKSFGGSIMIQVGTKEPRGKFYDVLLVDNKTITTREDFSTPFVGTSGLYKEPDEKFIESDGKTQDAVYYFAGNPSNNWVKFGTDGGEDIWWRIIRTNEDGSVRLLYAGKGAEGHKTITGYINASQKYNSAYDNSMYVGYMYGDANNLETNRKNTTDSDIKKAIDIWYDTNMKNADTNSKPFSSYISRTTIYCNDRATVKYAATSTMYYGAAMRLTTDASSIYSYNNGIDYGGVSSENDYHPTFKCGGNADGSGKGLWDNGGDVADKFTGSNKSNVGNEALKDKPIALMTADEVVYAGGLYGSFSENTYYYKNSAGGSVTGTTYWWTMSPYRANSSGSAGVFIVRGSGSDPGYFYYYGVNGSVGVRPVLSLKSCVEVTGKGTVEDPYIPTEITETCANADN